MRDGKQANGLLSMINDLGDTKNMTMIEIGSYMGESTIMFAKKFKKVSILWASCRQIYSIFEAEKAGCHIITVPHSILKKFSIIGKNLEKYSVETARDFYLDSKDIIFKF